MRPVDLILFNLNTNVRLLVVSNCENTTARSLVTCLPCFPDSVYLDLSSTQGSINPLVLGQIGGLTQLTVLKMQNCGLRDGDVNLLRFSRRLRSLDVRDNDYYRDVLSNPLLQPN